MNGVIKLSSTIDSISKLIDYNTLLETYDKNNSFRRLINSSDELKKLYNMYTNLSTKEASLEESVVNPKTFCDTVCKEYVNNTPI